MFIFICFEDFRKHKQISYVVGHHCLTSIGDSSWRPRVSLVPWANTAPLDYNNFDFQKHYILA